MIDQPAGQTPELGAAPSVTYNRLFLQPDVIFRREGVPIFAVVSSGAPSLLLKQPSPPRRIFPRMAAVLALFLALFASLAPLPASAQTETVTAIRVIGNRRIPKETVLARLFTHPGDAFDPLEVERDFNSLWNTGYFEDVRIEREDTPKGLVLTVYVREKPTIREINYKGLNSVTQSDVLEAFKKAKVGLSVESQYDPTRVKRAETVVKELLAAHGHEFATIRTEIKSIPPASVSVNFNIKEGPKVKVGRIEFTGNEHLTHRQLRAAMKNLRPVGIPHSLIFENLFAKTYDATKLEEDTERVRQAYRDRGYFKANMGEPATHIRNEGGLSLFTFRPRQGKRIDIRLPVEEGDRYRLAGITFTGNKAVSNTRALRAQFAMKDGDYFSATLIGKGLENLRKAYGQLGYINFAAVPTPEFDEAKKTITLKIDIDEGKAFHVSRIEFQGNTVTRDRVIRRELLLEEGQVYNSQLWELSLLRLNQLDYFEPLKVEQDSETHQDANNATVDLLLKVKEKGKNSIGLNGGISGLSGSFLGLNYQTNNFLGLGETLSVQASVGDLSRNLLFGFTQPYFRNRPLNLGFQVFATKYDYNSAKNYQALNGSNVDQNLSAAQRSLLQNYNQSSTGFTLSASYPLRRSFKRIGVTYSLTRSSITAFSEASSNLFQTLAFRGGIAGQNALGGIINSSTSFSFSYNNIDSVYKPRHGKELSTAFQVSGLWGNVRYFTPIVEYKQFMPVKGLRRNEEGHNVFGYRVQASYVQGFGGAVAPPNNRFFAGGENDIRGFDVRAATPYGYIPTRVNFNLTNPDGTCVPRDPQNPQLNQCVEVPLPVYGIVSTGGDTTFTTNAEYRIPIAGPVTFAFFNDFNVTATLRGSQLEQSVQGFDLINSPLYGCPAFINGSCVGGTHAPWNPSGNTSNNRIRTIAGTNAVPRMSTGAELQVILPIVNAPFRIFYAYNPLRLTERIPGQTLITRSMFPTGGAGDYTYAQAIQLYGSLYQLREPTRTFRFTVSTTF